MTAIGDALEAAGIPVDPGEKETVKAAKVIAGWEDQREASQAFLDSLGGQPLPPLTAEQRAYLPHVESTLSAMGNLTVYAAAHQPAAPRR